MTPTACISTDLVGPAGGENQACQSNNTCNANLYCLNYTCQPAGGSGQTCIPGDQSSSYVAYCNAGFGCSAGTCVAAGALNQPCMKNSTCNTGLGCDWNSGVSSCQAKGNDGQDCLNTQYGLGCTGLTICNTGTGKCVAAGGLGQACVPPPGTAGGGGACQSGLACQYASLTYSCQTAPKLGE